ncbi:hypothetical protein CW733_06680 [Lacinutrix sp. Bg11-31]|nr:hypothetical protein CW733_06680 [Lacinutrix sp. Bg11-31]
MVEYRRATVELKNITSNLNEDEFSKIRDLKTIDPDCKSILTVVNHCIQCGYTYANYIDALTKDSTWLEYDKTNTNPLLAIEELDKMLDYTESILEKISHFTDKELQQFQIKVRWQVTYDVEQLLEHAIVHVLRHRLQIENFLKD